MAEGIGTCKKNNEEELLQSIEETLEESTSSLYKPPAENSKFYGLESHFNNDVVFYQNVTIHGKVNYNFTKNANLLLQNLVVVGTSTFFGFSDFYGGVYVDENLNVAGIVTAKNQLDVGCGGTTLTASGLTGRVGIATINPQQTLDVRGTVTVSEKIGIGSVNPQQKVDVAGSIKIDEFIYDSVNYSGANGSYLSMDEDGIRWVTLEPSFTEGIFVQDEGVYIPIVGAAQSFTALNFKQINSLGLGTDTIIPIPNPSSPTFIADIQSQDLWGFNQSENIYRMTRVGIQNNDPQYDLDVTGTLHVTGAVEFDSTLDVDGDVTLNSTTPSTDKDTGALVVEGGVGIEENLNVGNDVKVFGTTSSTDKDTGALVVEGGVGIEENLNVGNDTKIFGTTSSTDKDTGSLIVEGGVGIEENLNVGNDAKIFGTTSSTDKDTGALVVEGGVGIEENLNVGQDVVIDGTIELNSSLIDINNSTATGKFDYRLASVGTGVSWRPSGVETQNTIWVTKDGNDSNTGLLEGDAKATVGGAAAIAQPGDTIVIRPGVYTENNPIGLRNDVTVTGQDLRLVTIRPTNTTKDVFHVRRGCLIENINFAGTSVLVNHPGCGAVAFPPTNPADQANSGYIALGPADEGPTGRWRSPYIRNCTNFMTGSIGMKINGDHATASTPGNDLKCMVCDSFTQYNENGIGVSITNNGYAQLVSIFTINCDIGIYADTGGSCDLTNSNSSFGNFGLYAVGIGSTEFTGEVGTYPPTRGQTGVDPGSDIVTFENVGNSRRPYDGQTLFFKIDLSNYPDAVGSGVITQPMVDIQEIVVTNGGSGYSAASPPTIIIRDTSDNSQQPKGPQGIIVELSPTIDEVTGEIIAIDVINSGRNYLSSQNLEVFIDGGTATANVITRPIYYAVDSATENSAGITTVTFTDFIPYELFGGEEVSFRRISRILTSSHSFEYIGTGTDINTATPFTGGVPIKANEIVALDGAQIPFTSTDKKGNFDIGEGFQINQPTSTIRGRDFSKAIQAEVTPLILALR